jgi:hypothetical protein
MKTETLNIMQKDPDTGPGFDRELWKSYFIKQETVINQTVFCDSNLSVAEEEKEVQLSRLLLIYFNY